MKKWIVLLAWFLTFASCQRAKDTGKKLWASLVGKIFTSATTTERTTFQEVFGKRDSLHVRESEGLRVEFAVGFYAYFLTYHADQDSVLHFLSSQHTKLPDISEPIAVQSDGFEMNKALKSIESKYPDVRKQLDFFYLARQKSNIEYYSCNKYPNAHHLAFDTATGLVFHHIENYWD